MRRFLSLTALAPIVCLMAGCNPAWCAKQLGHSKEMFLRIYADWIDADDRGAELRKVDPPICPVLVPDDGADEAAANENNEMGGRRDWTRTNDPHHVKVVL